MKKKKDNIIHDIKIYNIIMSNVWKLITFLLIGVLGGFLFEHYSKYKDFNYMLFSIVLFAIIGIIDFFVSIVRDSKRLEKAEKKKKEKELKIVMNKMKNLLNNDDRRIIKLSFLVVLIITFIVILTSIFLCVIGHISVLHTIWLAISPLLGYLSSVICYVKIVITTKKAISRLSERASKKFIFNNITNVIIYLIVLGLCGYIFWPSIFLAFTGIVCLKIIIIVLYGKYSKKVGDKK